MSIGKLAVIRVSRQDHDPDIPTFGRDAQGRFDHPEAHKNCQTVNLAKVLEQGGIRPSSPNRSAVNLW